MNAVSKLSITAVSRVAVAALVMAACMGSASAGLFDDEEARKAILDLRQKNQVAEQKLAEETRRATEDTAQLRRSLIELQNQLEATRAEVAKLRGQDEQVVRDLAELQRLQKDTAQSLDERLRKFEPSRMTMDGKEFVADPSEKRDYDAAMAIFRKGEFATAQLVFVDFLTRYPKTGFRQSALFWLGNAQYATKDYKDALSSFRALVVSAPDHMRVPEAILAIANCQLELKDNKGARKTLEELVANHPGSEAAQAAKDRLARLR
ncbi:MAG: tol-pal system protein YbgF [Rhodoferax sp.]|nr:tol-pal system protein YbgF [Rhodoferax sp.]